MICRILLENIPISKDWTYDITIIDVIFELWINQGKFEKNGDGFFCLI